MSRKARPEAYSDVQRRVGERILWVRELVIPNQAECARLIGTTPSTLNKIEAGTRAASIFIVIGLANRLRVSTDFLLRGELVGLDPELERRLIALHPELVLSPEDKDTSSGGTGPGGDKRRRPRKLQAVQLSA